MGQVRRLGDTKRGTVAAASSITDYEDFVFCAERTDARTVSVTIDASPVGRMAKAQKVSLPLKEAAGLRGSFLASFSGSGVQTGQMRLTQAEATTIGKRLAPLHPASRATRSRFDKTTLRRSGALCNWQRNSTA